MGNNFREDHGPGRDHGRGGRGGPPMMGGPMMGQMQELNQWVNQLHMIVGQEVERRVNERCNGGMGHMGNHTMHGNHTMWGNNTMHGNWSNHTMGWNNTNATSFNGTGGW